MAGIVKIIAHNYLVYKVNKMGDTEFANAEWDLRILEGYSSGRSSAIPFAVSLLELMKAKVIKSNLWIIRYKTVE